MPHADLKIRRGIEPHRILPRQENARDCPHALDGAATNVQPLVEYWGVLQNINRGSKEVNGNKCVYKIVRYNVNGVYVYWRFHVLFDEDSGKCCIVSCYDRNESTDYVNEVLESIRFK